MSYNGVMRSCDQYLRVKITTSIALDTKVQYIRYGHIGSNTGIQGRHGGLCHLLTLFKLSICSRFSCSKLALINACLWAIVKKLASISDELNTILVTLKG